MYEQADEERVNTIIYGIKQLDYNEEKNRIFLSDSYRKLEKLVSKKRDFCIFDYTNQQVDYVEEALKYSKNTKPYMEKDFSDPNPHLLPNQDKAVRSKLFLESYLGMRRCFKIKVRIDGEIIETKPEKCTTIYKNSSFNLLLESEPNSLIMYTRNGKHPLLVEDLNERIIGGDRQQCTLEPPCYICAVAVSSDNERIQSELTVIEVKVNPNMGQKSINRNQQIFGMERPLKNYNLLDSSSIQLSQVAFNIDPYSNS